MKYAAALGLAIVLLIAQSAYATQLSMEQFLDNVRLNHPFFAKEQLQVDIEKRARDRHLGDKDWVISSTPTYVYQEAVGRQCFFSEPDQSILGRSLC